MVSTFEQEVKQGERFQFGKNWQRFLSVLNEERIAEAEKSLKQMLDVEDLQGKSFLDIGSGSGWRGCDRSYHVFTTDDRWFYTYYRGQSAAESLPQFLI